MFSEDVKTKDGNVKHVVAGSKEDLSDAVKLAKGESAPVYPNINHPVAKGHDMVGVGSDVSKVLLDGEGAHNSPMNAVNPDGSENGNSDVQASGLDEPAYKSVPVGGNDSDRDPVFAKDSEVAKAKKDAKPADEVK